MAASSARILIVEDTMSLAISYAGHLKQDDYEPDIAQTLSEAQDYLAGSEPYDVVLLDLQLPDGDGLDLLESFPKLADETNVIVITADGSINRAVGAMRSGAYDFIVKPLSGARLLTSVRNAVERTQLKQAVKAATRDRKKDQFHGFIGRSKAMQAVYRAIENVARSNATVFITGESGTGKEVAAEAIHQESGRRNARFVAVNCGAIPENLLESELFGHVKGAFTGAVENRIGAAKEADGGTLFLDEVGEMDLKLQVKLLRFLQTGMIQRVGTSRPEPVDVRVICATNRNPAVEVAEGRFREDLFYRLAVIPLELPPLRERGNDIELLGQSFLRQFADQEGKTFDSLPPEVVAMLSASSWPGNVRELQNVMRRAVIMNSGPQLGIEDFSIDRSAERRPPADEPDADTPSAAGQTRQAGLPDLSGMTLEEINRLAIETAIENANGSLPAAAGALGVSPSTLYRKRAQREDAQ